MTPYRESANPLVKRAPKTPWWRLLRAFFWSKRASRVKTQPDFFTRIWGWVIGLFAVCFLFNGRIGVFLISIATSTVAWLTCFHSSPKRRGLWCPWSTLWLRLRLRKSRRESIASHIAKKERRRQVRLLEKESRRIEMERDRIEEDARECQRKAWAHAREQMERIHAIVLDMNRRPK